MNGVRGEIKRMCPILDDLGCRHPLHRTYGCANVRMRTKSSLPFSNGRERCTSPAVHEGLVPGNHHLLSCSRNFVSYAGEAENTYLNFVFLSCFVVNCVKSLRISYNNYLNSEIFRFVLFWPLRLT